MRILIHTLTSADFCSMRVLARTSRSGGSSAVMATSFWITSAAAGTSLSSLNGGRSSALLSYGFRGQDSV